MTGIRIQHPSERDVTFTLVDGSRPYPEPIECGACRRVHLTKTYHLALDDAGAAIVSIEIWGYLQRIPFQPFSLANEVPEPPAQVIHLPSQPRITRALAPV